MKGGLYIKNPHLIFITNELLDASRLKILNLPLTFITFGIIEGKMYKHFRNEGTFVIEYGKDWGNTVVYGALFAIRDFDFYMRALDSYHQCSLSLLGFNHPKDVHHREIRTITPIKFSSIEELETLRYKEGVPTSAFCYLGNKNHPKIKQRLDKTVSYRIVDGIDSNFIKIYREVQHEL